jgi:predicted nucleic acid-binding protein
VSAFVLDTSIALKWFLEDENDRVNSLAILRSLSDEHRPIVPWLWYYEMANVLLIQVRRKRIVFEELKAFLSLIGEMAIDIDPPDS